VSKSVVEETGSKRRAKPQMEFTPFHETRTFIHDVRSYVRSRITRQHHFSEVTLSH
jgi:hypothetical protein